MRISLFNVFFSDNVGDAVISDNIVASIKENLSSAEVQVVDLGGRDSYTESKNSRLKMLSKVPSFFRTGVVLLYVLINFKRKWRRVWYSAVKKSDLVVIGGGQLFYDSYLNFPIKLYLLSMLTKRSNKKVCIFSVGVSRNFSLLGRYLLTKAVKNYNPVEIYVRDLNSKQNMQKLLKGNESLNIKVVPDPAVVSDSTYTIGNLPKLSEKIGVCITSLETLCQSDRNCLSENDLEKFYEKLIREIISEGRQVVLYTNGSLEDEIFKEKIFNAMKNTSQNKLLEKEERVLTAEQLVKLISSFSSLVAHRLHSNIIAFSLGIPAVGLEWDEKVNNFYCGIGLVSRVFPTQMDSINQIVKSVVNPRYEDIVTLGDSRKKYRSEFISAIKSSPCFNDMN